MQYIFTDTRPLDAACRASYALTEEIMMENAAMNLERVMRGDSRAAPTGARRRVLILCGKGNNGADGYALARRLRPDCDVAVLQCAPPQSELCKTQAERAARCGVRTFSVRDFPAELLQSAAVAVDCVYGSGFHGELDETTRSVMDDVNKADCLKISCDVPSGISEDGNAANGTFRAHVTVAMGALKLSLFSDVAKDLVGTVVCGDLGVGRGLFESASATVRPAAALLEESDLVLPERSANNVNKGSFGHAAVASGEKRGASVLAARAALSFGAGLVSLVDSRPGGDLASVSVCYPELMVSSQIPQNTTAIAFGMGLGSMGAVNPYFDLLSERTDIPCVVDADALKSGRLAPFLAARKGNTVLTPHPKEFKEMMRNTGCGDIPLSECVLSRPKLIEDFCRAFPKTVLLVKGANTMIGCFDANTFRLFVNPHGSPALAKGGSGDVLSGMICALLAQRRSPLDAALNASLAHALAGRRAKSTYSLTPQELIGLI